MLRTAPSRERVETWISKYWLPFGYLALLSGLFWVPERSLYSKVFYGLIAFPALLAMLASPRKTQFLTKEPVVVLFFVFAIWLIISLLWSNSDQGMSSHLKRPLYALMLFGGCLFMALAQGGSTLGKALLYGAIATTIGAIYSLYLFFSDPGQDRLIGSGSLSNPLLTSHLLGFTCAYWLACWSCVERYRTLAFSCSVILLLALLATGSRTPLMAMTSVGLGLVFMVRSRQAFALLAFLVTGFLLLVMLAPDVLTQRGLSYRPDIWSETLQQIMQNPWLGQGYASPLAISIPAIGYTLSDPHNVALAVTYELGVIGLLLWCLMYAAALGSCIRFRHDPAFVIASAVLIYGLMAGMTEGSNFLSRPNESWFLTWIPLALVASLSIRKRLEQTSP